MTVSTAETAITAAVLGVGLTRVLSYQVADTVHSGQLVRVLTGDEPPAVPVSLIYPGQGRLPMRLCGRAVAGAAEEEVGTRFDQVNGLGGFVDAVAVGFAQLAVLSFKNAGLWPAVKTASTVSLAGQ